MLNRHEVDCDDDRSDHRDDGDVLHGRSLVRPHVSDLFTGELLDEEFVQRGQRVALPTEPVLQEAVQDDDHGGLRSGGVTSSAQSGSLLGASG